jgi:hypothetical protein
MTLTACLDALQVHALAAAGTADATGTFVDVAVGFPVAKGRSVRVFYDGERDSVYFGEGSLNSQHVAQTIVVRAMWPEPTDAASDTRTMQIQMGAFAASFRTRVDGDFTLGGGCTALKMLPAPAGLQLVGQTKYAVLDWEIGLDLDDYTYAP